MAEDQFSRPRRIIINADDFGYSSAINRAILTAFQEGLISSTTIMANMPGFEEACAMAKQHDLNRKIGVHLNLTEGPPLTHGIRRCPRFCDADGRFRESGLKRPIFRLSTAEKAAVEEELRSQIQHVIDGGIQPTHFDSHHHVHTEWPIGAIVIRLAKQFGVPAVRLSANFRRNASLLKRVYKAMYNRRVARHGLAKTRYFGALADFECVAGKTGDVEAMVHPKTGSNGEIVDIVIRDDFAGFVHRLGIQESLCGYAVYGYEIVSHMECVASGGALAGSEDASGREKTFRR